MDRLKGTWKFTKVVERECYLFDGEDEVKIDFVSNGESFNELYYGLNTEFYDDPAAPQYPIGCLEYIYRDEETNTRTKHVVVMEEGKWVEGLPLEYRTIEILSDFYDVEDYDILIEDLESNATFTPAGTDYVQIPITSPTGVRLRTKNKFVGHDIGVVPVLSDLTVTQDGVYEPDEYSIGFKKVTVEGVVDYDTVFNEGYSIGLSEGWQGGYNDGRDDGIEEGKETGKQEEYDRFWDAYQQNGNRLDYSYAFAGYGWNDETFNPKYDIKPTHGSNLFSNCQVTNFVGKLDASRVSLDTSNLISFNYLAQYSKIEAFPVLDMRKAQNLNYFLYGNENLHTIDKIILKSDGTQTFSTYTFFGNTALTEIRFEGVIGQNGLNFQHSTLLSKASITSIINALSSTTSGLTITLSNTAKANAFPDSSEWNALVATKSNWTIALV